jgi:hypothetical protein
MRSFFTHINAYMFETMIMLPLKYIHHILIYLWFSFHQVILLFTMSHIMTKLPKLPLRKCPLHSKFPGSLQSSHSVSWNCRPTQYFGHHKITWSNQGWGFLSWGTIVHPFNEVTFVMPIAILFQIPNLTEMQFQAMVHRSVNEIFYWLKHSYVSVVNHHWTLVITK